MIHWNLTLPQFLCDSTVLCLRKFPTASCRHHELRNVHYVPVEQRQFQSIRVDFLTLEGLHVTFENSESPTKFIAMHTLEVYYFNQAGRGLTHSGALSPVYLALLYLQRGHGIGNSFGSLFRWVRHLSPGQSCGTPDVT